MFVENVAKTTSFITASNKQLLTHLTVDISKTNVAKTIGVTTFPSNQLLNILTVDVSKSNGSSYSISEYVVKLMVLAPFVFKMV